MGFSPPSSSAMLISFRLEKGPRCSAPSTPPLPGSLHPHICVPRPPGGSHTDLHDWPPSREGGGGQALTHSLALCPSS